MKKILLGLAVTVLLFGCGSGGDSDTAAPESGNISADATAANVALTDDLFITLSAKILCLPSNNAEASSEQIETLAKQILTDANVSANDFSNYQKTIEADPTSKHELSLAIVGKMSEFCSIGAPAAKETNPIQAAAAIDCTKTGCPDNSACYHSQYSGMGPNGLVVGDEEGDLKCHLKCLSDSDCGQGETCQNVDLTGGDIVMSQQFCLAE